MMTQMITANDIEEQLFSSGYARRAGALSPQACLQLRMLYDEERLYRSRVVMERHNYGSGEYKYFAYPLPEPVRQIREDLYAALAPIANRWNAELKLPARYPAAAQQYLLECHEHGQTRPTALILRYGAGDYNCLHQDTYGELAFPFQATFFLSDRNEYEGGEFVLVEQRPRSQSRPIVIQPEQGECIIIPNRYRPVPGKHGTYRTVFRHGVSEVRAGERFALGIIFHDAL
ncbi:MAG TPA: 2OG-Fe(II) oxygenase [Candidatus Baltobacteraceae bacterium]|nr:2OG-Fe(II) oxygenase [Candidatus Baltobacteraceae bacterium]